MRHIFILSLFFLSACSTSKKNTPHICDDFLKSTKARTIKGIHHCNSITIANGVIIRLEENNYNLITHVEVLQCPNSYKRYGDIGINGIIIETTKQVFNFTIPSNVDLPNPAAHKDKKKTYFLNGFLISNDSLKISTKSIKRVEVLKSKKYFETQNDDGIALVNIWTSTKKEVRKSLRKNNCSYK